MLGWEYPMPEEGYRGAYIPELARAIFEQDAGNLRALAAQDERLELVQERGKALVLASIRRALEEMGVSFDTWFSERYLVEHGWNDRVLAEFRSRGVVYEKDGAVWLRSTDFGDDKDRVLVRRDGEPTYTLTDAAYHFNKYQRGYTKSIDIFGADHIGHIVPMQALMKSLGMPDDFLEILIYQIVHFLRGGQQVVLSKQTGEIIELADLVREVGRDQARVFSCCRPPTRSLNLTSRQRRRTRWRIPPTTSSTRMRGFAVLCARRMQSVPWFLSAQSHATSHS